MNVSKNNNIEEIKKGDIVRIKETALYGQTKGDAYFVESDPEDSHGELRVKLEGKDEPYAISNLEKVDAAPADKNEWYEEFGGFVKNEDSEEYELMFVTYASGILAKNRAIEKAKERNGFLDKKYNIEDVLVKKRLVRVIRSGWFEP